MFRSQANRVEKSVGHGVILWRENLERIFNSNLKTRIKNLDRGANLDLDSGLELGLWPLSTRDTRAPLGGALAL